MFCFFIKKFGGDFMVLNYIYAVVIIHILLVNYFLSIDLKMQFQT